MKKILAGVKPCNLCRVQDKCLCCADLAKDHEMKLFGLVEKTILAHLFDRPIPLFSSYLLPLLFSMERYDFYIERYSFEKTLRLMSYGFIKILSREKLGSTAPFRVEMFSNFFRGSGSLSCEYERLQAK